MTIEILDRKIEEKRIMLRAVLRTKDTNAISRLTGQLEMLNEIRQELVTVDS